ncbi:hypothetical protein N0V85_005433 [Neurospora sp. IMI 360204]|nr:hypothetical protein N0V85_005433 [Neurospora sp. IMI 360204]
MKISASTLLRRSRGRGFVPRVGEPFCSGIIFHYENGGSRVVGEVRLINDRASIAGETIIHPKLICLEWPKRDGSSISQRIHFLTEADIEKGVHPVHTNPRLGRCTRFPIVKESVCYPMEGTIDWWFTASERMRVEIRKPVWVMPEEEEEEDDDTEEDDTEEDDTEEDDTEEDDTEEDDTEKGNSEEEDIDDD